MGGARQPENVRFLPAAGGAAGAAVGAVAADVPEPPRRTAADRMGGRRAVAHRDLGRGVGRSSTAAFQGRSRPSRRAMPGRAVALLTSSELFFRVAGMG